MRIIVTGTPGTGKTQMAHTLGRHMGYPILDIKKYINEKKIYRIVRGEKEKTVNLRALQRHVNSWFRTHENGIAESHLLCEFNTPADLVVVLRCQPDVLEKRLEKRRYSHAKILANLQSEALDYCLIRAEANYRQGRVMPVNATRTLGAKNLADRILQRRGDHVDWSEWLRKNAVKLSKNDG